MTAFGSFVDGRLASYAITCLEDGWLQILHKMNSLDHDHLNPSHVLDFTLTRRIVESPDVTSVSMGWAPLLENRGLHEYKRRLGYDFENHNSVICLHPALDLALTNPLACNILNGIRRLLPTSYSMKMACAVVEGARVTRALGQVGSEQGAAPAAKPAGGRSSHQALLKTH